VEAYYVYILRCFDGTFYVGVTNNVDRRFAEHAGGLDPDCYTFKRRPLMIAHVSEFAWVDQAIAFEKKLKSWSHRKKRAFIDGDFEALARYSRGRDR
jgi:putative endonuclease